MPRNARCVLHRVPKNRSPVGHPRLCPDGTAVERTEKLTVRNPLPALLGQLGPNLSLAAQLSQEKLRSGKGCDKVITVDKMVADHAKSL